MWEISMQNLHKIQQYMCIFSTKHMQKSSFPTKIYSDSIHVRVIALSLYRVRSAVTVRKHGSRDIGDDSEAKQSNGASYPPELRNAPC